MRTPGMITLSSPTLTSSPSATPSCRRAWARMSHERPMIEPSTSAPRPMCVDASMTERVVRARSRSVTLADRTEYAATWASGAMRQ